MECLGGLVELEAVKILDAFDEFRLRGRGGGGWESNVPELLRFQTG